MSIARRKEIEQENNTLLLKMLNIMQRGAKSTNSSPQFKMKNSPNAQATQYYNQNQLYPGGGISHPEMLAQSFNTKRSNSNSMTNIHIQSPNHSNSPNKVGSLNFYKRKKDQLQINQDNRSINKALQNVQPVIKRDELVNHEIRIKKLKQHLGQIRYGSGHNFMFPAGSPTENHNFSSTQFLFMKNPSQININSPIHARKRSASNLLNRTAPSTQVFSNHDIRAATANLMRRSRGANRGLNQSADFTKFKVRSGTPTNFMITSQSSHNKSRQKIPQTPVAATGSTDERRQEESPSEDYMFQLLLKEKQKLKEVRQSQQATPQHNHRRLRSQCTTKQQPKVNKKQLEIMSNYNVMQSSFQAEQSTKSVKGNPYRDITKKFVQPRPLSSTKHHYSNHQINIFNQPSTTEYQEQSSENISRKAGLESTIKFIEPKININCIQDDQVSDFNYNIHFKMNNDTSNTNLEMHSSPQFMNGNMKSLSPTHQQRLDFTNSFQLNPQHTALDLLPRSIVYQTPQSNLSVFNQQLVKESATNFIKVMSKGSVRRQRIEFLVKEFIGKLQKRVTVRRAQARSDSVRYSGETFEKDDKQEQSKNKAISILKALKAKQNPAANVVGKFRASKKRSDEEEQQIIANAQKLLTSIRRKQLQIKAMVHVKTFINLLKDKVQQRNNKLSPGKNTLSRKLTRGKTRVYNEEEVKQPEQATKLQKVNLNNMRNKVKSIQEQYQAMSSQAKTILQAFFDLVRRRVRVKVLVKQFIKKLKSQAAGKFLYKQLARKVAGRLHIFMNQSPVPEKSVSVHYSEDSNRGEPMGQNFEKAQLFLENIQKSCSKQREQDSDEKQARNASKFLENLKFGGKAKAQDSALGFVKNLKSRVDDKGQHKLEMAQNFIQTLGTKQAPTTQKFYQKLKAHAKGVRISHIKDQEFQKGIVVDFKRLFIQVFQLKAEQRQSRIYPKYYGSQFKEAIVAKLRVVYQNQQEDGEIQKQIQAFLHINDLKEKYLKERGVIRAKEYMEKLRTSALQKRSIVKTMIRNYFTRNSKDVFNISKIKDATFQKGVQVDFNKFLARLLQFTNEQRGSKIYKLYLMQKFKQDLSNRVRTYIKTLNNIPDEQKAQLKVIKGFLYLNELRAKYVKQKGMIWAKVFIQNLRNKVQKKAKQVRNVFSQFKQRKSVIVLSQSTILSNSLLTIANPRLWQDIGKAFKKLIAKIFQLSAMQRQSAIHMIYLVQDFKRKLISLCKAYITTQQASKLSAKDQLNLKQIQGFVLLSDIKYKWAQRKGQLLAKKYVQQLHSVIKSRKTAVRGMFSQLRAIKMQATQSPVIEYITGNSILLKNVCAHVKQLVARILLRNSEQRVSRIQSLYLMQQFKSSLFATLEGFVSIQDTLPMTDEQRSRMKTVKGFLKINKIKGSMTKEKGLKIIRDKGQRVKQMVATRKKGLGNMWGQLKQIKATQKPVSFIAAQSMGPFTIAKIQNQQFHQEILRAFKQMIALMFQRKHYQRDSNFRIIHLLQVFKQDLLCSLITYVSRQSTVSLSPQEQLTLKQVKAYIKLNKIKYQILQDKAQARAYGYIVRLRTLARLRKITDSRKFKLLLIKAFQPKARILTHPPEQFNQLRMIIKKLKVQSLVKRFIRLLKSRVEAKCSQSNAVSHMMQMLNQRLLQDEESMDKVSDRSYSIGCESEEPSDRSTPRTVAKKFVNGLIQKQQQSATQVSYNIVINDGKGPEASGNMFNRQVTNIAKKINTQENAQRFIAMMSKKQPEESDNAEVRKDENVKKFVNIFKKSYGKGKIASDDHE